MLLIDPKTNSMLSIKWLIISSPYYSFDCSYKSGYYSLSFYESSMYSKFYLYFLFGNLREIIGNSKNKPKKDAKIMNINFYCNSICV